MSEVYVLGIDPAKRKCTACLLCGVHGEVRLAPTDFPVDQAGFDALWQKLLEQVEPEATLLVGVEATAALDDNLLDWLLACKRQAPWKMTVMRLDAAQVAHFSGPRPVRGKTDKADARRIARFALAYATQLQAFTADPEVQTMLRLVNERGHLVQDRTALSNRLQDRLVISFPELELVLKQINRLALVVLARVPTARCAARTRAQTLAPLTSGIRGSHALGLERAQALVTAAKRSVASACSPDDEAAVRFQVQQLQALDGRIASIEQRLQEYAQSQIDTLPTAAAAPTSEPATEAPLPAEPRVVSIPQQLRLADSLPGIGLVGASTVVLRTGGLLRYSSASALAAQLGACPDRVETGTSTCKGRLTYRGDRLTRGTLYMLTQAACKSDPAMRFHKWRMMRKGLTPKQAVCACMNRLVHWLYAVVRSGVEYSKERALKNAKKHHAEEWIEYQRQCPPKFKEATEKAA